MFITIVCAIIALIVGIVIGGYVGSSIKKSDGEMLDKAIENLRAESKANHYTKVTLQGEIAGLKEELSHKLCDISTLKDEREVLKKDLTTLANSIADLSKENRSLSEQLKKLEISSVVQSLEPRKGPIVPTIIEEPRPPIPVIIEEPIITEGIPDFLKEQLKELSPEDQLKVWEEFKSL